MSQPVSIHTQNACVDFPIFDAKSRSLKKAFLGKAGGSIGRNDSDVVVVEALRDITMTLKEGDRIGLVGHNGAGKSTCCACSPDLRTDRGSASIRGRVAPVFDLGVGMDRKSPGTRTSSSRPVPWSDPQADAREDGRDRRIHRTR